MAKSAPKTLTSNFDEHLELVNEVAEGVLRSYVNFKITCPAQISQVAYQAYSLHELWAKHTGHKQRFLKDKCAMIYDGLYADGADE